MNKLSDHNPNISGLMACLQEVEGSKSKSFLSINIVSKKEVAIFGWEEDENLMCVSYDILSWGY